MNRTRRLPPIAIVTLTALLLSSGPALADCQPAAPIEQVLPKADVAFVGTVTTLEGPVATFAVREVWAGEVADTVVVRDLFDDLGGVDAGFGAGFSEDDRQWTAGETYLVVPWVDGDTLRDNICTATTEWSAELEALRPGNARILTGPGDEGVSIPPALILAGAVLGLIAAVSVLAFRRR
jgi:hypothetical protein